MSDEMFISFIKKALKAGYLELPKPFNVAIDNLLRSNVICTIFWKGLNHFSGLPKAASSLFQSLTEDKSMLFNIYMRALDKFIKQQIIDIEKDNINKKQRSEYTKFQKEIEKTANSLYNTLLNKIKRLKKKKTKIQVFESSSIPIRVRYNRYADDWVIGIAGPKSVSLNLKDRIDKFISEPLYLELSPDKTKVTNI